MDTPTVSASSVNTGASFTLTIPLRNAGNAASEVTVIHFYRSADSTIDTADTAAGASLILTIVAGGTVTAITTITAPATAGTYFYGACVDAVSGESDTTNNCSAGVEVVVSASPSDLVVDTPTVSKTSLSVNEFTVLTVAVRNRGTAASAETTLTSYRSTDATISTSDIHVSTVVIPAIAAGGEYQRGLNAAVVAPATAGTYYFGACAAAVAGESDTTNNCSTGLQVTVTAASPQSTPNQIADVDNSGDITAADGILIARYLYGLRDAALTAGTAADAATVSVRIQQLLAQ